MPSYVLSLIAVLFVAVTVVDAQGTPPFVHDKLVDTYVRGISIPDEYIIQFDSSLIRGEVLYFVILYGGELIHLYDAAIKGTAAKFSLENIVNLLDEPKVIKATYNKKIIASQITQTRAEWGLDRIVPPMDKKYKYKYLGTNVLVFVLDTGIRQNHSEFGGRASCGWTAFPGDNCDDLQGHGTHVAGIVGGRKYGVAKNSTLLAVKVLNNDGKGTWADVIAGINYAMLRKSSYPNIPMIIIMGLAGRENALVSIAVQNAISKDVVVVVAAGNDDEEACDWSPASATNAITVGATDKPQRVRRTVWWRYEYITSDVRAWFSNSGHCVDTFAPGVNIRSASISSPSASITLSGTSFSAAFVAGVAALHLEKNPALVPGSVRVAILNDSIYSKICTTIYDYYDRVYRRWTPCPPLNFATDRQLGTASLLI